MAQAEFRSYQRDQVISFRKTTEDFGGLSNMAPGFPITMLGQLIRTSEALYQACRFPHRPDIQRIVIDETSPMTAKMKSKPYRKDSRPDWEDIRVQVMRWCLRVKLAQNWETFSTLLLATGDRPIVEDSRKDDYWGAKAVEDDHLAGRNVLGRLLMELREVLRSDPDRITEVLPLDIPHFVLLGRQIPTLKRMALKAHSRADPAVTIDKITQSTAEEFSKKPTQGVLL
ncbi:NADAR family protein [Mesorhizobium sp. M0800]|uniref:NADAR family protein n=1 Tax=Mesorhizobium sp. M0800 TaxID=2957000 RepID=UPI0033389FEC